MTDPFHALYGRQFELISSARDPDGHVLVRYRDGIVLRIPRTATSLLAFRRHDPCDGLCRPAVDELLSLVKEYGVWPTLKMSPHAKSGTCARPKTGSKSSKN